MSKKGPKIFISHSLKDNEISRTLAQWLEGDGSQVWIHYDRLTPPNSLDSSSLEGIKWCNAFLLVWSNAAKRTRYVTNERECAVNNNKRIILCTIDKQKVPKDLAAFPQIEFRNFEQGYNALAQNLKITPIAREPEDPPKILRIKPSSKSKITIFRSTPQAISYEDAIAMVNKYDFFDRYKNDGGRGFKHQYERKIINQYLFIIDRASTLMWQQSGPSHSMPFDHATRWIAEFNKDRFAGFNDWRIPTLEEAMSLMQPGDMYTFFINRIFDIQQGWIWTSDPILGFEERQWVVLYHAGHCTCWDLGYSHNWLRAVRSMQSSDE